MCPAPVQTATAPSIVTNPSKDAIQPVQNQIQSHPKRPFQPLLPTSTTLTQQQQNTLPYITINELSHHNSIESLYVSIFNNVFDLTKLITQHNKTNKEVLCQPLLAAGGKDISHWFDSVTQQPKTIYNIDYHVLTYIEPNPMKLRFLDCNSILPSNDLNTVKSTPNWWNNNELIVARITRKSISIKICNVLSNSNDVIECCIEETLGDIEKRYRLYNSHSSSYTWKRLGKTLNMKKNLIENNIIENDIDNDENNNENSMQESDYIPTIHVYFNDDLTTD